MARRSRVDEVVDGLFDDIVARRLVADQVLPSEPELGERFDVSRVTVREAIKTLQARGVVRVESGRGSFVQPLARWTSLSAVLAATSATGDASAAEQLIELRRIFETGAAALAAERARPDEVEAIAADLAAMRDAHEADDLASFVAADLSFHDRILAASRNPFLTVMFAPLTEVLSERRAQTSAVRVIQHNAIAEHEHVLEALRDADAEGARRAMDQHMQQTLDDLRTHVLGAGRAR
ncbi:DNA-binding FadR family transcriptional regulator [Microbacterium testaceum]|uniref:FadR/GntR family transcriptional regulator n=1 Tax=Microbacterium TaxID=33882 RepID=UPI001AE429D1|nr:MULTISPECIES: FCD domain-containing protein [Microbacterium]MDQ1112150.1 DNA-binding FadR family transcriptional regulator [Microbacterium testaceum]MDQ1175980.1 DNA-binding FadR family transcriptional regulator [Microbacterium sp. SORGH_AS_0421]MDR6097316.1 DNA-binding FadR family transcriptional regulator [Microbacterium sp. SORGH_AS_0454]WAC69932.1 FCD domain-containing protein [Microbacterium sp. SL75]